jgi:hypothetical protein
LPSLSIFDQQQQQQQQQKQKQKKKQLQLHDFFILLKWFDFFDWV